jgi:hypothetical protein
LTHPPTTAVTDFFLLAAPWGKAGQGSQDWVLHLGLRVAQATTQVALSLCPVPRLVNVAFFEVNLKGQ